MENNIPICEADNTMLKQKTLSYLPRNLGEMEAHRQILTAIAKAVPEVAATIDKAELTIWPNVHSGEVAVNRAIAQCAFEANAAIGSSAWDSTQLRVLQEEALMEAWIALDYYSYVLKADYSGNLRNLQNHIGSILLHPQPVTPEDIPMPGTPVETDIPDTTPIEPIQLQDIVPPTEPVIPIPEPQPVTPVTHVNNATVKTSRSNKPAVLVAAALAVVVGIALLVSFVFNDVRKTESAIGQINTVTLDSGAKIQDAEKLYNELDAEQQEKVDNSDVLFAARAEYDALVTDDAIRKIGTVTMNSAKAIEDAEKLYDELSRESRNLVKNYKTLTAARKEYSRLETAIQDASDAIDAIGTVTLESESTIRDARSAYDALKKDNLESYLTDKASILTAAEKEYDRLVWQDLFDTGTAYSDKSQYQEAIDCFDNIIVNCTDPTILQNTKDAKANAQIELARKSCKTKDYYTATLTLRDVDSQYHSLANYEEVNDQLLAALKKNRANNAAVIGGKIAWGQCYFKVTAGDQDVCFKFQSVSDPSIYKLVYVRAGQSTKVNVKDGTYSIKWATGEYWFGKDHMFGPDTVYKQKGTVDFTTTRDGSWIYYWYMDLNLSETPSAGSTINASAF